MSMRSKLAAGFSVLALMGALGADPALAGESPAPVLAFHGLDSAWPRWEEDKLALQVSALQRVRLTLWRLEDHDAVRALWLGRQQQSLDAAQGARLVTDKGHKLWQATLATGESGGNGAVSLPVPLQGMAGRLPQGLYLLVAEPDVSLGAVDAPQALQWFLVADARLSAIRAGDGWHFHVATRGDDRPVAGAELRLTGRDQRDLAQATTDAAGDAFIANAALGDPGTAQAAFAFAGQAVAFLDLGDLKTGDAGKTSDVALLPDRASYRPDDTVILTVVTRAPGDEEAAGPMKLAFARPDGLLAHETTVTDAKGGVATVLWSLPAYAAAGDWTATLVDASGRVRATRRIPVQTATQTPALVLTTDRASLRGDAPVTITVKATDNNKRALANLGGRLVLGWKSVRALDAGEWADFEFGPAEIQTGKAQTVASFTTDAGGIAHVTFRPDVPKNLPRPLQAVVTAEMNGQAVGTALNLAVAQDTPLLGIAPNFARHALPEGAVANFTVRGTGFKPDTVLTWRIVEETRDFEWFMTDGRWESRPVTADQKIAEGKVELGRQGLGHIAQAVKAGRYRLDVMDAGRTISSSSRFTAGWWVQPDETPLPDRVSLSVMEQNVTPGGKGWVFVRPPYAARVTLIFADDRVRQILRRDVQADGDFIEIQTGADWPEGVHVVAVARELAAASEAAPRRQALGTTWFPLTRPEGDFSVSLGDPRVTDQGLVFPVRAERNHGAPDETPLYARLLAVPLVNGRDKGDAKNPEDIAWLPANVTPRPQIGFLDSEGLRLDLVTEPGTQDVNRLPHAFVAQASAVSAPVTPDAGGRADILMTLPTAGRTTALQALVWSSQKIREAVRVFDTAPALHSELNLPEQPLRVGDSVRPVLVLEDPQRGGVYRAELKLGPAQARKMAWTVNLKTQGKASLPFTFNVVKADEVNLDLNINGPEQVRITRRWSVKVERGGIPALVCRDIAPQGRFGAVPSGLSAEAVNAGLLVAPLQVAGLQVALKELARAPLMTSMDMADADAAFRAVTPFASGLGWLEPEDIESRRTRLLDRLMRRQQADGGFAVTPDGHDSDLAATTAAVLMLAARKDLLPVAFEQATDWLRRRLDNAWSAEKELDARAAAFAALADAGKLEPAPLRYFVATYGDRIGDALAEAHLAVALRRAGDKTQAQNFAQRAVTGLPALAQDNPAHALRVITILAPVADIDPAPLRPVWKNLDQAGNGRRHAAAYLAAAQALAARVDAWRLTAGQDSIEGSGVRVIRQDPSTWAALGNATAQSLTLCAVASNEDGAARAIDKTPSSGKASALNPVQRRFYTLDGQQQDSRALRQGEPYVVVLSGRTPEKNTGRVLVREDLAAGVELTGSILPGGAQAGRLAWLGALSPLTAESEGQHAVTLEVTADHDGTWRAAYLVRADLAGNYGWPAPSLAHEGGVIARSERAVIR